MSAEPSVKHLVSRVEQQDSGAVETLLNLYLPRLEKLSAKLLSGYPGAAIGPEDIAQSTMKSFVLKLSTQNTLSFSSHDSLWSFLATCAKRKAQNKKRDARTLKRGQGKTQLASEATPDALGFSPVETAEGTVLANDLDEACVDLLEALPSEELRTIAILKLHGYSPEEIAHVISKERSTAYRKIELIKKIWKNFRDDLD